MNTSYVIKGWENLNNEFDKLDSDPNVEDYTYDTIHRGDTNYNSEYEFQVIYKN